MKRFFAVWLFTWPTFALSSIGQINASANESRAVKWHRSHSSATDESDQIDQRTGFDWDEAHQIQQPFCLLEGDRSAIYMSMPENLKKGAILGTVPIIGSSGSGQKSTIKLRIVKGHEFVRLNTPKKQLILRKEIDREQKGMEQLEAIIECVPMAPTLSNMDIFPLNISVFITVIDLNDNAPQFSTGHFSVQIPEELPEGTSIKLDLRATDSDQPGPNSRIRYRIVHSPPAAEWPNEENTASVQSAAGDRLPFEVFYTDSDDECVTLLDIPDPLRPELFVAGRIDFEKMPNFSVFIEAEDQGIPKLRTFARLDVTVTDVDDLNPTFGSQMYKSGEHRGFTLEIEPSPIRAWDGDRSFDEPIIYSLSGERSVSYAIDQLTGEVKLLVEKLVPANLIVQARQANRPERNSTAFLLVQPSEIGEETKKKKGEEAGKSGNEFVLLRFPSNTPIGTQLIRLVDENGMTEAKKREEKGEEVEVIVPKEQRRKLPFFVDQKTKWLRLGGRMAIGRYAANISIKMTAPKRPPTVRSLHIRLTVVEPIADGHFGFEKQIYEFELPTEGSTGKDGRESLAEIGRIKAKNFVGRNGTLPAAETAFDDQQLINYALLNGNDLFDIHPTDGVLRLQKDPSSDELRTTFELVVVAENSSGAKDFARCIVRPSSKPDRRDGAVPWSSLAPPDAALCLGLFCFLLLLTNCATLSLWLGKRRMANLYEQLAAYRYDSMGLAGTKQQQNANSSKNNSLDWVMNKALEGDGAVTIANWVEGNRNSGSSRTTWRTISTAEKGGETRGMDQKMC